MVIDSSILTPFSLVPAVSAKVFVRPLQWAIMSQDSQNFVKYANISCSILCLSEHSYLNLTKDLEWRGGFIALGELIDGEFQFDHW